MIRILFVTFILFPVLKRLNIHLGSSLCCYSIKHLLLYFFPIVMCLCTVFAMSFKYQPFSILFDIVISNFKLNLIYCFSFFLKTLILLFSLISHQTLNFQIKQISKMNHHYLILTLNYANPFVSLYKFEIVPNSQEHHLFFLLVYSLLKI